MLYQNLKYHDRISSNSLSLPKETIVDGLDFLLKASMLDPSPISSPSFGRTRVQIHEVSAWGKCHFSTRTAMALLTALGQFRLREMVNPENFEVTVCKLGGTLGVMVVFVCSA